MELIQVSLTLERFQKFPTHLVDALEFVNGFPSLIVLLLFKLFLFHCAPGQVSLCAGPSAIALPAAVCHIGGGIPVVTVSLSPALLCTPSVGCRAEAVSVSCQFFFRRNCFVWRQRVSVSMGRGDQGLPTLGLSPCCTFDFQLYCRSQLKSEVYHA